LRAFYAEASTPADLLEVGQRQRIFFAPIIAAHKIIWSYRDMKQCCGKCRHFEAKGPIVGDKSWGLCVKSSKKNTANIRETPFLRWEDDICPDFKECMAKQKLKVEHH
jgi:hypothetical protein